MRKFLPPLSMSDPNYEAKLRIFSQLRMHPWIEEHKLFIDKEIAKMSVDPEESKNADILRAQYDDKMTKYLAEQEVAKEQEKRDLMAQLEQAAAHSPKGETPVPVEGAPTLADLEKIVEAKIEVTPEVKVKRGRKPKISSPS